MLYLGAGAIIFAAFLAWREYAAYLDGELALCRSFLHAMEDLCEKMRCYLDSPRVWANTYSDELLEMFLNDLRAGEDIGLAYERSNIGSRLPVEADETAKQCFARFGEGNLDTELEILRRVTDKICKEEEYLSAQIARRRRAFGAVMGAFASGLIIYIV